MTGAANLLERDAAVGAADRLVHGLGVGHSGALFLVGEAGLGKTSILDLACGQAADIGLATGCGLGDPMESSLPFGLLAQALNGAGGSGLLDPGDSSPAWPGNPGNRAARFYAVLRWIEDGGGDPLLLAIDDLHWADPDSLALLSFLCRRMSRLRLGVIACLRPWPAEPYEACARLAHEGSGHIEQLTALSEVASGFLLERRVSRPLPAPIKDRAFKLSAGNPLLLEQVAIAIGQGADLRIGSGGDGRAEMALGPGLLLARFAGLPPEGMRTAQAASVLGLSFLPEIAVDVAGLQDREIDAAFESLGGTGLVGQQPGRAAEFAHPMFRQALYDDLPGPVRARLHARAFAALCARGAEAQAAEHAIAGHLAGEPNAIAVLERTGRAACRAGAFGTAAAHLDAAVTMAGDAVSVDLLLAHAEALLADGQPHRVTAACQRILSMCGPPAPAAAAAMWTLGRALVMIGDHDRAIATLLDGASLPQASDPAIEVRMLLDAAFSSMLTAGPTQALPIAARARKLATRLDSGLRIRADAEWGEIAVQAGDPAGVAASEPAAPAPDTRPAPRPDEVTGPGGIWRPVRSFAWTACLVERLAEADRAFTAARASVEQAGAAQEIAMLAVGHSWTLARMGRVDDAVGIGGIAVSMTDLVPLMESYAGPCYAYFQLYRGDLDASAAWCDRAQAAATARGEGPALLILWDVLGHRCLREGAVAESCDYYARIESAANRMGVREPCMPPWGRHAVAAYLAGGRVTDAERVIDWLDDAAQRLPCRYPRIAAATGRAQLAELRGDDAGAEEHYAAATALHANVDLPLEHAETLLAYGAFLRRTGHPARARPVLSQAVDVAHTSGAHWLCELAKTELKIAGGRPRRTEMRQGLTPQEERVTSLVATGASNSQIARQLFLSVGTVEKHLEHIYAKLGIRSRQQLIIMHADGRLPGKGNHDPRAADHVSVSASSSAETSPASAVPIRWKISSACRSRSSAGAA